MNLTLKEIEDTLKDAPPFHQKSIEDSFVGRTIAWELKFHSISDSLSHNKGDHRISCSSKDPFSYRIVGFDLNLDKYPEFKNLKSGSSIKVSGVIEKFSMVGSIHIKNVKIINFFPASQDENKKEKTSSLVEKMKENKKIEDNKINSRKISYSGWLTKNKKLITLIVSILIIILGGSKYIFSIKKADNVIENNIHSENQTGGITGNNINVYQQSSDANNFDISNPPSAFSLLSKVSQLDTTIEKENYIKTILGTEVGDSGYIHDISSGYDSSTYFVFLNKKIGDSSFIMCITNEKNEKFAILKKVSDSLIKFKGKVKSASALNNCEFQ